MTAHVRSVSQAFSILRLLHERGALSLSEICRSLDLSPSSGLNLLRTLLVEGPVKRDADTKIYRLAPIWAASDILRHDTVAIVAERARPLMHRLAERSGAAIGLWQQLSRDRMQLVSHAESDADMQLRLADRQRQPLGGGAAGRAFAAAQGISEGELARRFEAVRWHKELSFEAYVHQVKEASARGYAIDRDYAHRGVTTLAVAATDMTPALCFSASLFTGSRNESELIELSEALKQLCPAVTATD